MSQSPTWYHILEHFERKSYYQNGLTIPFLIGGQKLIEPSYNELTISEFIIELSSSAEARAATIMMCDNIGEYIVGLEDAETYEIRKTHQNLYNEFGMLICTDQSLDDANDLKELIKIIENRYSNCISDDLFSNNQGIWSRFSETDISRLCEVK